MSTCPHCNKSFANKYSLSAHKSRYHPKSNQAKLNQYSDDESNKNSQNHDDDAHEESDHEELDHKESDHEASGNESSNEKTESRSVDQDDTSKELSETETANSQTEESEESDADSPPDQLSDKRRIRKRGFKESTKSKYRGNKRTRQNRKSKNLFTENDDIIQLLSSINDNLQGSGDECFSLLPAHRLKQEYFSKLATEFFVTEAEMEHKLSEDEFWLVDAICKNDLETVRKLIVENLEMLGKLLRRLHPQAQQD